MTARPPIIAPSILSADFSRLAEELTIVDPARDWLHCDVMDHQFVPNLTFGPLIVAAARKLTRATLDVHLMMERPWLMVDEFRKSGADLITSGQMGFPQWAGDEQGRGAIGEELPLATLIRLRDHGVTPDFVQRVKVRGNSTPTVEELIRLRDSGMVSKDLQVAPWLAALRSRLIQILQ